MITKKEFEEKVNLGFLLNYGEDWGGKQINFDIMPHDFLNYAESDLSLKDNSKGSLVNALSNIKRAMDCQIELIISDYGILKKSKKGRWNFPQKIKFLKERNVIAPRILEKINKTRNMLEHEFKKPNVENVEDALDIVALFIGYTKQLRRVPDSINLGFEEKDTKYFTICFDKENFNFSVLDGDRKLFQIEEPDQSFERVLKLFYRIQPATYSLVHRSELQKRNY
jgi:hypothetical protein